MLFQTVVLLLLLLPVCIGLRFSPKLFIGKILAGSGLFYTSLYEAQLFTLCVPYRIKS